MANLQQTSVTGALCLSEISSPAAPADGAGGKLYVKSDGKPYFISNELSETDLSSGGSGDIGTIAGTVSSSINSTLAFYTGSAGAYDPTRGLTGSYNLYWDDAGHQLGVGQFSSNVLNAKP